MKNIIWVIIFLVVLAYLLEVQITIKPFNIKVNNWLGLMTVIGGIFLIIGISLISAKQNIASEQKGFEKGVEALKKDILKHYVIVKKPAENE